MDFIIGLSKTVRHHDSIMVVVDMLENVAHFIRVKSTFSAEDVVRLHGVTKKIVSDRESKFISKFLKELFASLDTELAFGTTYHRPTDG